MKKTDINVGEAYAYAAYEHSPRIRVVVVEKDVKRTEGEGIRARVKSGHLVRAVDGHEFVAASKDLRTTWAVEAAAREARISARREARDHMRKGREMRLERAQRADRFLEALGVPLDSWWFPSGSSHVEATDEVAEHAAELGWNVFYNDHGQVHFVTHGSAARLLIKGGDLVIPAPQIDALLDAAEVFL